LRSEIEQVERYLTDQIRFICVVVVFNDFIANKKKKKTELSLFKGKKKEKKLEN